MIGDVNRTLVPMIITFDEKKVKQICDILGTSISQAYEYIDLFMEKNDDTDYFE